MMFLLTSLLLTTAIAADKPACNAKAITRDCAFFKERKDQQKITLPDGTYYDNPLYEAANKPSSGSGMGMMSSGGNGSGFGNGVYGGGMGMAAGAGANENYQSMMDKALRDQSDILDVLDGSGLSNEFKLAYSQGAAFYAASPTAVISLPWPPTQKGAARKNLSAKELESYLMQKLGMNKYKALKKVVDAKKAPIEKQFLEQQKLQQEMLKQRQEAQETQRIETANKSRREARLKELFDYAKEHEIQILTRGKPESQWSDVEKAMVAKLRALKLAPMSESSISSICISNSDNAFYGYNGTVNLCPGKLFKPDVDVLGAIGHEIGHSIDPCYFQMPQWTADTVKLSAYLQDPSVTDEQKKKIEGMLMQGNPVDLDLKFFVDDEKLVDDLVAKGIFTKTREGFSFDKYPFKEEYSCLTKQTGFRENTKKDIKETVDFLKKSAALSSDPQGAKLSIDRYEKAINQYPQCLRSVAHNSQMGEVAGDMMGVLVQEKYVSEYPFKSEEEKVGSSMFARFSCRSNEDKDPESYSPSTISRVGLSILENEHPAHSSRVDHIALTVPGLADAYGCQRKGPGCFDHLSLAARKGSASGGESSATESQGGRK